MEQSAVSHQLRRVTSLPWLDASAVASLVTWQAAQRALETALRGGLDLGASLPRAAVPTRSGELLLMPAESDQAVGFKLLSLAPGNPSIGAPRIQGLYVLFDAATLTPQLLIDGPALTSRRTAAVSALAIAHLAVPEARALTILGTGPQSLAHARAIASIRPIAAVRIVPRQDGGADSICAVLRDEGIPAEPGGRGSLRGADIVVCATTSAVPLFDGDLLNGHACVVAIGSHQARVRELDGRVFARASRVVVEDRATALREAGDVIQAIESGAIAASDLIDLGEMIALDRASGLSVFKSVGMGWQDLVLAETLYAAWMSGAPG